MKSKEYAELYLKAEDKDKIVVEIANMFLKEISTIIDMRNAKSTNAIISILNDLNQKWIKFASIVNSKYPVTPPILYSGFKNLAYKAVPQVKEFW